MDKCVVSAVASVMSEPEVIGMMCSGKSGLSLAAAGIAPQDSSGFVSSIAARAQSLEPGKAKPTVVIESTTT